LENSDVLNSYATSDGGVFYILKLTDGDILIKNSRIKDFTVDEKQQGSLMFSNTDEKVKVTLQDS
jgi:hypothetical protein